jgi:tRNA uridine 5-carboxymethylaminomethyl modification enzyme
MDIRYAGYIEKENREVARGAKRENMPLSADLDYASMAELSAESREKLAKVRPLTLGQASRIPGIRQGDLAVLMVKARKGT